MLFSDFAKVDDVIKDIIDGRQQGILFMGEQRLYKYPKNFEIDTIDILRSLKPYEVPFIFDERTDEDEMLCVDDEDNTHWCIEKTWGEIKDKVCDNTYNWNAQISNDIEYAIYRTKDFYNVMTMQVNLHGDVRGNYSPRMVFVDPYRYSIHDSFYDAITATTKTWRLYQTELNPHWEATITGEGWDNTRHIHVNVYGVKSIEYDTENYEKELIISEIWKKIGENHGSK